MLRLLGSTNPLFYGTGSALRLALLKCQEFEVKSVSAFLVAEKSFVRLSKHGIYIKYLGKRSFGPFPTFSDNRQILLKSQPVLN